MDNTTQYIKLADDTMQVIVQPPTPPQPDPITTMYSLDQLNSQKATILQRIDDFNKSQQTALADVQELIDQATKLGLKTSMEIQADTTHVEQTKLDNTLTPPIAEETTIV